MKFITGENIQQYCQYYLGNQDDFEYNPVINKQIEKQLDINQIETLETLEFDHIFCYTNVLTTNFNTIFKLLQTARTPFTLICHNHDNEFSIEYISLMSIPLLKKIYTQNLSFTPTQNIKPLPIGLANSQWQHGNLNIFSEVYNQVDNNRKKEKSIYFWFDINTNPTKRNNCFDIISKIVPFLNKKLPFKQYLELLSKHQFCICPEGNGFDTHRFWEAIYLKVVPICIKSPLTFYFSNYVPVVLLDDWSDLNTENLNYDQHHFLNPKLNNLLPNFDNI